MKINARHISLFVITAVLLLSKSIIAQQNNYQLSVHPFNSGEKVTYRAVYNWGLIWINAGDVVFNVNDTIYSGVDCYRFKSFGWSLKQYDWFFKVRDKFESVVSKDSLKPFWFIRDTYEGGSIVYNHYDFDYKSSQLRINSYTSDRPSKQDILHIKPNTFDVLSAIYYCRNINFEKLSIDQKIPLAMAIDNEVFNLYIRYLGRETITLHGGKTYSTFKFSAMLVKGTIFKGGEDLFVWVTDDKYHIPVLVEAKILIGSVKAVLVGVEGLKNGE